MKPPSIITSPYGVWTLDPRFAGWGDRSDECNAASCICLRSEQPEESKTSKKIHPPEQDMWPGFKHEENEPGR
ncbi:hypothetical protein VCV18_008639 [Metarhizium anisopliae]